MKLCFALAVGALWVATPACAQDRDPRDGSVILHDFGQCVVNDARRSAIALLASMPSSASERTIVAQLKRRFDSCLALPDNTRFLPILMRGAVAAALYDQLYASRGPGAIVPQGYGAAWLAGPDAPTGATAVPYAFAACFASANPQAAQFMTDDQKKNLHLDDVDNYQKRLYFWQNVPRREKYNEIWNEVKAAQ